MGEEKARILFVNRHLNIMIDKIFGTRTFTIVCLCLLTNHIYACR